MRRMRILREGKPELVIEADAKWLPWKHLRPGDYFEYHWRDHKKVVKGARQASRAYSQHKFFAVRCLGRVYCMRGQEASQNE